MSDDLDLAESVAGEEDPGASIDMPLSPGTNLCPACGGSGQHAGADCPVCRGTGKVTVAGSGG